MPILDDSVIEPQEAFSVQLSNIVSNLGIGFVDGQATNSANGNINDDDAVPGTGISFASTNVTVTEGTDAFARFTVNLNGDIAGNVSVDYATIDGSATDGSDFTAQTGTITFTPTSKSFDIDVPILDDSVIEPQEAFSVQLSNIVSNLGIGFVDGQATNSANGNINDDDAVPGTGISFASTNVTVTEGTDAFARFTVNLNGDIAGNVSVDYATIDGSATDGSDFTAQTGTITFTPTSKSFDIDVPILDDSVIEPQEAFSVQLSNIVSNLGIGFVDGQATNSANGNINDDDAVPGTGISFASTNVTVTEGTDAFARFTVNLNGDIAGNVSVDYATIDGSATDGSDFTAQTGTITFTPTSKSFDIDVPILDDSVIEPQEAFSVQLSNIVSNLGIGFVDGQATNSANGNINDDDAVPGTGISFASTNVTVTEGTDAFARFTVNLNGDIAGNVSVDYATIDGSATDGSDFTAQTGTITFTPTSKSFDIDVPILDDSVIEPQEAFSVQLSNIVSNLGIGFVDGQATNSANGNINDDDAVPGTGISFASTNVTVTEGTDAFARFTVNLNGDIAGNVSVDYATIDGSATDGSDFTAQTGTITFTPTSKSFDIDVPILDDSVIEPQEAFSVQLSNIVSNLGIGFVDGQATNSANGNINDDDAVPGTGISFASTNVTVTEGTDAFARFTVNLNGDIAGNVSVDYATIDGSATDGSDFTAQTGTITFTPTSKSFDIDVPILDDSVIEPQEAFSVQLSNIVSNLGIGFVDGQATNSANGNINDDDAVPGTGISFASTNVTVTEGTDAFARFTVNLNGDIAGNVSVDYATIDGSATDGSDFTAQTGTITFTPTSKSFDIDVPILDDSVIEPQEAFSVQLSNIVSNLGIGFVDGQATNSANGNINDDDAVPGTGISFASTNVTVTEGTDAFARFTVNLNGDIAGNVSVDYATIDGSATDGSDFTAQTGTITFTPTSKSFDIDVPILDDSVIEPQEAFSVQLSNIVSNLGIGFVDGQATNSANGNINDDDAVPGTGISFASTNVTVTEGTDAFARFTVNLNGDIAGNVSVDYATIDGSATDGSDFTAQTGTITFTPTSKSFDIDVPILDDSVIEPQEAFSVQLSNIVSNLGIGFVDGQATNSANGNINDDDAVPGTGISFASTNVTVTEGTDAFARFTVNLNGDIAGNVSVDYATIDGSATDGSDFTAQTGTITFTPTSKSFDIDVPILDDSVIEPQEAFSVQLSNIVSNLGIGFVDGQATNSANGNINDDDAVPGTGISFASTNVTVTEGTDAFARFTVNLNGDIAGNVSVDYATIDGSATDGSDFTAQTGTITFTPTSKSFDIDVPILDDSVIEPQEAFSVQLSNIVSNLGIGFVDGQATNSANGNINDDDAVPGTGISFASTNVTVTEGTDAFARFTVNLNGDIAGNVSVDYATIDGSATDGSDFTAQTGTITFTPTSKSFDIDVPILDDSVIEPQEAFSVQLSNIVSNLGIGFVDGQATNSANGNINDDDAVPGTGISFASTNVTVTEGTDAFARFTVNLNGDIAGNVSVDYATIDGSATDGSDFTAQTGTITFTPTSKSFDIDVPILDDSVIEPQEAFSVQLSNIVSNLGIGFVDGQATNSANGNINDDDAVPGTGISFASTNVTVTEGTDAFARFTVNLNGDIAGNVSVDYATIDGSATDGSDFTAQTGTITFTPTSKSFDIDVPILDDSVIEPQEAFSVQLSNIVSNLGIGFVDGQATNSANGNINDDDAVPGTGISFASTNVTVTEGTDATAIFEVVLTGNYQEPFDVSFETAFGTADATDFDAQADILSFLGNDGETQTIEITILDDTIIEPTENYIISLTGVTNPLVFINTPQANGSILDDDADPSLGVQFDVTSIDIDEGAGTVSLNVILNADVQNEFTVAFNTTDGLANDPFDYTGVPANTQILTFGGGNPNTQNIIIPIIDDIIIEDTEDFQVVLSDISTSLVNLLANDTVSINIIDNDGNEGYPTDSTIEACDTIPPAADITSSSSCAINVVLNEDISGQDDECATEYTITRTWTITDCVGNVREHAQVITIEDTVAPTFVEALPQDMTVACNEVPEAIVLTAIDSCEPNIEVIFDEVVTNSANCATGYTVTRTWNASDCAGNTVNHMQVITVPPTGPIMADPFEEEITILCGDTFPEIPQLTFTGGCGDYQVVFSQERQDSQDSDDFMIIHTWDVTDSCGNTASFEQIIFVLQPQLVEVTIDICVEDEAINLLDYLPEGFHTNGEFMTLEGEVILNGALFDPFEHKPGEYKIAYSSTGGECKYFVDFAIVVNTDCVPCGRDEIEISTAVTPNGDGTNDHFEIRGVDFCQFVFDVMVFNRWGDKVYASKDYQNDWGGSSPGSSFGNSGVLPAGTYYYIITATDTEVGKTLEPFNGYIYLGSNR